MTRIAWHTAARLFLGFAAFGICSGCTAAGEAVPPAAPPAGATAKPDKEGNKVLVVYFSRSGNTRALAKTIQEAVGADLFEIQVETPYPAEYNAVTQQAKKELEAGVKPPLKTKLENIDDYGTIFVGSPCWWATVAPPVMTFLSGYDLSGKTVIPFMTHEGSGLGRTMADVKKLCPKSTVRDGKAIRGGAVNEDKMVKEAADWARSMVAAK